MQRAPILSTAAFLGFGFIFFLKLKARKDLRLFNRSITTSQWVYWQGWTRRSPAAASHSCDSSKPSGFHREKLLELPTCDCGTCASPHSFSARHPAPWHCFWRAWTPTPSHTSFQTPLLFETSSRSTAPFTKVLLFSTFPPVLFLTLLHPIPISCPTSSRSSSSPEQISSHHQ